jgi:predicted nucleic acid-binding protein
LRIEVANDPRGDFELIVKVDGNVVTQRVVNVSDASAVRWFTQEVDLSPWAGKECRIELENRANGWSWEAAYWSKVECLPQSAHPNCESGSSSGTTL